MVDNVVSEERKQELMSMIKADDGPIIDIDKLQYIRYGDLQWNRRALQEQCRWTEEYNRVGLHLVDKPRRV